MPTAATATRPTGKRSKRGILNEGAPTKQTPEVVAKIAYAISLGATDDEAAGYAGISDLTLVTWRKDPAFLSQIKNAVSTRLVMRLAKIESGADGWQGSAWLAERLLPQRYSKPEVQISLSHAYNQTTNMLSITIAPEEAREIEAEAAPVRASVKEMFASYKPALEGGGNGEGRRTVDVEALPIKAEALAPITDKGDTPEFWRQFASGSGDRLVSKEVAIYAAATVVNETVGRGLGNQAIVAFKSGEPITVAAVLAVIERLSGPAGFQLLQRKAGFVASPVLNIG
jgi:hypothetical protein